MVYEPMQLECTICGLVFEAEEYICPGCDSSDPIDYFDESCATCGWQGLNEDLQAKDGNSNDFDRCPCCGDKVE